MVQANGCVYDRATLVSIGEIWGKDAVRVCRCSPTDAFGGEVVHGLPRRLKINRSGSGGRTMRWATGSVGPRNAQPGQAT